MSPPSYQDAPLLPAPVPHPQGSKTTQGNQSPLAAAPQEFHPTQVYIRFPVTTGRVRDKGKPWGLFFGGILLGVFLSWLSLIPIFLLDELKNDTRKRKYYLWGALLGIVVPRTFVIFVLGVAQYLSEAYFVANINTFTAPFNGTGTNYSGEVVPRLFSSDGKF